MKKPSYCPEWFDIEAYKVCAEFGRTEWIFALHERQSIPSPQSNSDVEEFFQHRLATLKEYLPEDEPAKQASAELAKTIKEVDLMSAVREADLDDLLWRLSALCETTPQARDVIVETLEFDQPNKIEARLNMVNAVERAHGDIYGVLRSRLPYCDTPGGGWGAALLDVDLFSPDDVLREAFDLWLKAKREELGRSDLTKPLYTEADFAEWHRLRVLAYIDLSQWCELTGTRLTYPQMGNLLYPDEYEVDTTDRVRKTVSKKAEELLRSGRRLAGY